MIWEECLKVLRQEMPDNSFTLWIKPLTAKQSEHSLWLYAPNTYFAKYITDNFLSHIRDIIFEITNGIVCEVEIKFDPKFESFTTLKNGNAENETTYDALLDSELALLSKNKAELNAQVTLNIQPEQVRQTLNKGYVFEEFVEGATNKMAFETCKEVVDQLGSSKFNPLFLYGATGLGKTHLMQAVGHAVLDKSQSARVMYLTSAQFVSGFVTALRQQQIEQFKKECRNLDLGS